MTLLTKPCPYQVRPFHVSRSSAEDIHWKCPPGLVINTCNSTSKLAGTSIHKIRPADHRFVLLRKSTMRNSVKGLVRLVLASVNAIGLCLVRRAVSRRFGRPTGLLFTLLTCSQFHIPFWMGRTLPNMFALFPGASRQPHDSGRELKLGIDQ